MYGEKKARQTNKHNMEALFTMKTSKQTTHLTSQLWKAYIISIFWQLTGRATILKFFFVISLCFCTVFFINPGLGRGAGSTINCIAEIIVEKKHNQ